MSSEASVDTEKSSQLFGWTDGLLGAVAGSGAGLCCVGPILFSTLGLSGVAGALAAMPFTYQVVLQWIAVIIMIGTWAWFLYKWLKLPVNRRWNWASIVTAIILVGFSIYVFRSWARHILI